ncbi:MAG TPA: P-aminobenzoate N-oxygenase AurF [Myxococcota bacterium]|nr:P-aminobenzoate N-oxygenase AurF [Myxococcota bacterium]
MSAFDATSPLREDAKTWRKLEVNLRRNREQDQTEAIDAAAAAFRYEDAAELWWNDPEQSLLHATPLWDGATEAQRRLLNQLFWVAYYSQIISAEVATIYFNQTSAAGLYGVEDFRLVCDTLDLESAQERAHIAAFKAIGEATEHALFGERLFTWPMRGPFEPTMIYADLTPFRRAMRRLELRTFGLLSAGSAFIGCQYFTVRGLRTLNGKMVQQRLSRYHKQSDAATSSIPSRVSWSHFMDESFHFNSSHVIGLDVVRSLPRPTAFERAVVNLGVRGCQADHSPASVTVRGLFWSDPAAYPTIYRLLRTRHFGFDHAGALDMLRRCYAEENEAQHLTHALHAEARASYARFVEPLDFLTSENREMRVMAATTLPGTLAANRAALDRFVRATPGRAA